MGKNIWPNNKDLIKNRISQKLAGISSVPDRDLIIQEGKITHSPVRTDAGRTLPEYYLVYFLLHDIMKYNDEGMEEKVAFSFPIKYKNHYFDIEYRKLGLGIFAYNKINSECYAKEIVQLIHSATKIASPYFDYLLNEAKNSSNLNLFNNNKYLYNRYKYLLGKYKNLAPPKKNQHEKTKHDDIVKTFEEVVKYSFDIKNYHLEKQWLSISVMEAYFSWTEHLFIHLSIISNNKSDGKYVIDLANKEWGDKYKSVINIYSNIKGKLFYDQFIIVRNQLRNFITHGAIGKDYNSFTFHSHVGAIPIFHSNKKSGKYTITPELYFEHNEIIELFEKFTTFLWESELGPAMYYAMESSLPTILPYAKNNYYKNAVKDMNTMKEFVFYLSKQFDDAANMDW